METNKRLIMNFKTAGDKTVSISIDDPKQDISEEDIKTTMNLVISKNIFSFEEKDITTIVNAKIVETDTTIFEIA